MADAAVEFLLGNLQKLLHHHIKLITSAKDEVEKLEKDIQLFKIFLNNTAKRRRQDGECFQELVGRIRDVVYKAEDAVDAFVTQAAIAKSKNYFTRALTKPMKLHDIAKKVHDIHQEVKEMYNRNMLTALNDGPTAFQPPEDLATWQYLAKFKESRQQPGRA